VPLAPLVLESLFWVLGLEFGVQVRERCLRSVEVIKAKKLLGPVMRVKKKKKKKDLEEFDGVLVVHVLRGVVAHAVLEHLFGRAFR